MKKNLLRLTWVVLVAFLCVAGCAGTDAFAVNSSSSAACYYGKTAEVNTRLEWNLGSKYRTFSFEYGVPENATVLGLDNTQQVRAYATVLADGKRIKELSAVKGQKPQKIALKVAGVKKLVIERKWRHFPGGLVINPHAK